MYTDIIFVLQQLQVLTFLPRIPAKLTHFSVGLDIGSQLKPQSLHSTKALAVPPRQLVHLECLTDVALAVGALTRTGMRKTSSRLTAPLAARRSANQTVH
uniref:Putative secreted protein n=1 Tax=Ixodes ricinus TaxID=34613 RepID=A0A6B0U8M4_IXORI